MTWDEWKQIVARLNLSFPGQQIKPDTAREWFEELRPFPEPDVWLAVRRCRREQTFRPALAQVLDAVDANDRDEREQRRTLAALAARPGSRRRGAPMPTEAKRAVEILEDRLAGKLEPAQAKAMINQLADQLERRLDGQPVRDPDPSEATRICPDCATATVAGTTDHVLAVGDPDNPYAHPVAVVVPCPGCRPVRAEVLAKGGMAAMSLRTDADGWPLAWKHRLSTAKSTRRTA